MKKTTIIITILSFALGITVLALGFILLTENNISGSLFPTTTQPTTTTTTRPKPTTGPRDKYDPIDMTQLNFSDYVTLGEYAGITVEVEHTQKQIDSLKEMIQTQLNERLQGLGECEKFYEGTIEKDTLFNFNYSGSVDGVVFEGGTAKDVVAYIEESATEKDKLIFYILGGTQFIDGFAEGILGAKPGDEFDIDVTFPQNYGSEELAGKKAVFHIKINYLVGDPIFTDEWVVKETDGRCTTKQEYLDELFDIVVRDANFGSLWQKIMSAATVAKLPEAQVNAYYYADRYVIEDYAISFGMTYEEFMASGYGAYIGLSYKTDAELRAAAESVVKEELIIYAIANEQGLSVTDGEYKEYLADFAEQNGVTEEEVLRYYTEQDIREQILIEKLVEYLTDNNEFTIKIVPETQTNQGS